jgi:apolipoprotein N-acyltransferase
LGHPAAGLILGLAAWKSTSELMPLSLLLPILWYKSTGRVQAYATVILYTLAATCSVPTGTAAYLEINIFRASIFWLVGTLWGSLPYLFFHFKNEHLRKAGLVASLFFVSIPPFGLTGWVNPLTGVGFFWPLGGVLALGVVVVGLVVCCLIRLEWSLIGVICLVLFALIQDQHLVQPSKNWVAVNTAITCEKSKNEFGLPTFKDFAADYQHQVESIKAASEISRSKSMLLFPESSGGTWMSANAGLWRTGLQRAHTALVGATLIKNDYKINSVIEVTKEKEQVVYRQRMPVPLSMWWPGRKYSYRAGYFKNPVTIIDGKRVSFFVCYEQVLVWPVIDSALHGAELFCATSNVWWARKTDLPFIQNNIMHSWARLFGVPLIISTNS